MPIFKLTAPGAGLVLHVRARCLACARNLAVDAAGPEGPRVWRYTAQSTIELVRGPVGMDPEGRSAVLRREEIHE